MAFSGDQFRETHRAWSFTLDGRTFLALHVSAMTVMRYDEMLEAAKPNLRRMTEALYWLLRHAFPWKPSYLLRGDPVRILLELEPQARKEALADFFAYLRGPSEKDPKTKTRGTRSHEQTVHARA